MSKALVWVTCRERGRGEGSGKTFEEMNVYMCHPVRRREPRKYVKTHEIEFKSLLGHGKEIVTVERDDEQGDERGKMRRKR